MTTQYPHDQPDRGPMVMRCVACEVTGTDEDMIFRAGRWWHPFCLAEDEAVAADRDERDDAEESDVQ